MKIGVHPVIHVADKFVPVYCNQGFINFMVSGLKLSAVHSVTLFILW